MTSGICVLDNYQIIQVSGEDAAKFLHGQLTVNTEKWKNDSVRITAHCDFKGKMWSISYLLNQDNRFSLLIEGAAAEQTLTQLRKYGVFSNVSIDVLTDVIPVSFHGEESEASFKDQFSSLPTEHLKSIENDDSIVFCISASARRYIGLLSSITFEQVKQKASSLMQDSQLHEWLEITDGYGVVTETTVNEYVPQMFNLQCIDGIDFDKGCYMGQEVVARTKFLGKNKRALYLLETSAQDTSEENLSIGVTLERQVGDNWRRAGNVIRVAKQGDQIRCLAVLPNDITTGDTLRLKEHADTLLSVQALPYSIDVDK
ncbi:MAG: tRNA-modifying protein YgfZ [Pseudomonadota bacterium]